MTPHMQSRIRVKWLIPVVKKKTLIWINKYIWTDVKKIKNT